MFYHGLLNIYNVGFCKILCCFIHNRSKCADGKMFRLLKFFVYNMVFHYVCVVMYITSFLCLQNCLMYNMKKVRAQFSCSLHM
jgi:hypothetical protein